MIATIVPARAVAVETFGDPPERIALFPEEEAVLGGSVAKRRDEFTAARWCARTALRRLGRPAAPILPGERGAPGWPAGIVGSITHCDGYRACVLARETDLVTVGIDAEPHAPLPDGILDAIGLPAELDRIRRLAAQTPRIAWDRLLFSAKEAVYKAWFPLTHRFLDFDEADIVLVPDGTFTATLLTAGPVTPGGPLTGLVGRWAQTDDHVFTCTAIARDAAPTSTAPTSTARDAAPTS
ncbi:4'-phosphopantetheinyl transferase superfamily protein [Micromonospora sp. WMMD882]|uniref:4'-phosphopantetheinyl transferase family protein n=1 Tax=Micromonospora sp. WMMD882 TaxID=3015151 RepID=UPI00248BB4C1|nr:4'-phosphopantetheinyl transferase superfamily protein [Micromonospora sp. WMMD882]WBB80365.1 4'-phosphopantetheinyl transferase superfamily protein [Micromonospora sp. WMMD882]